MPDFDEASPGARLRVVVAEDDLLTREGVCRLLESSGEVEVVAAVGDAEALRAAVTEHRPSVVLTDIRMPPGHHTEGIVAAKEIRRDYVGTGVVVSSVASASRRAMALGAPTLSSFISRFREGISPS